MFIYPNSRRAAWEVEPSSLAIIIASYMRYGLVTKQAACKERKTSRAHVKGK